jgi:Fe-S-cluster containining protein
MINKENFKCVRCADCCKFTVILDKQDLKKIKTNLKDYEKYINLETDPPRIKLKNDKCIFLDNNNTTKSSCKIYAFRPKICKRYPFFKGIKNLETCKPTQNKFLNKYNALKINK